MNSSERPSRRGIFGVLLNGVAGVMLAVPILRYLFSPLARERKPGYRAWVSLGSVEQFPAGQTRFATYRNPVVTPSDGDTASIACWVRSIDGEQLQIFAINCAHLGCPVSWFPQSGLFMCPCHGGVYYENGERASGPPPRGLFHCVWRVRAGQLEVQAPHLPTLQNTLVKPAKV